MVLERAKCDLNGVKIAIFSQNRKNHSAAGGSAPSVTRLSSNGFVQHGTYITVDSFCAKNIYFWFKPLSFSKTLVALLVAFTPADIFFKRLYRPNAKPSNKRCRA